MTNRILWTLLAVIAAASIWIVLASLAIIAVFGFWSIYPWPGKGWVWLRYLMEARSDPIVRRWLWLTGIAATLPFLAIVGIAIRAAKSGLKRPALYGSTGFADGRAMSDSGIKTSRTLQ